VLHNLSFVEDPTRVFRAIRFEQRYGFTMAKHTQGLIKNAVKLNLLERISGERLLNEIRAILEEENFLRAIDRIKEFDLIKYIHPDINLNKEEMLLLERARDVLAWYKLLYMEERVEEWLVLFLAVIDQLKDDDALMMEKRFAIAGKHRVNILEARGAAIKALNMLQMKKVLKNSEVYKLLKPIPMEDILYIMAKAKSDDTKKIISNFITHLKDCNTLLNGDDLKRLDIPEGPIYSRIFNVLLEKRLDEKIKTKADEEKVVKEIMSKNRNIRASK